MNEIQPQLWSFASVALGGMLIGYLASIIFRLRRRNRPHPLVNHPSFQSTYHLLVANWGFQYYLATRYALAAELNPVCGSLARHAIEMLLKSCLAKDDPGNKIAEYRFKYRHNLKRLWKAFRVRNSQLDLDAFDGLIRELDRLDDVRYPDSLVIKGGLLEIGLVEPDPPNKNLSSGSTRPDRRFTLHLPAFERLAAVLIKATGISRGYFDEIRARAEKRTAAYLSLINVLP